MDLPDGVRALGVATGANHTCIHDQRGDVWCWGSNLKGQLGSHVFAIPDGVVLLDSGSYPWLVSSWDQTIQNQFSDFGDGLAVAELSRFTSSSSVAEKFQDVDLNVPLDATLVLNLSAEDVDFGLDVYLDGAWVMGSNAGDVDSTWYNASVPLSAGEHTLKIKLTYTVGNSYGWDDYLHLHAALHGMDVAEGGAPYDVGVHP